LPRLIATYHDGYILNATSAATAMTTTLSKLFYPRWWLELSGFLPSSDEIFTRESWPSPDHKVITAARPYGLLLVTSHAVVAAVAFGLGGILVPRLRTSHRRRAEYVRIADKLRPPTLSWHHAHVVATTETVAHLQTKSP
jgi:hypothetical protein